MTDFMHIGKDFTPPDVEGKVTGAARYAEDFRKEGMVFARLLTSPLPSGRVLRIDASEALAMEGVLDIITADDLPPSQPPANPMLAKDFITYVGQPILAVAATSERIAEAALEKIVIDFERRPFVTDPLDSLTEGGADAYPMGNTLVQRQAAAEGTTQAGQEIASVKWSNDTVAAFRAGREPVGARFTTEWEQGDLEAQFAQCTTIVEEPFVTIGYPHHSLESRTGMAYWENGKCYFHGSLQSHTIAHGPLAAMLGVSPENICLINENTGGGFGSKITPYPMMGVCGHFARKLNRPLQLRITREEEFYIGSARSGMQGWVKVGVKPDGKIGAIDLAIVNDAGAGGGGSGAASARHMNMVFQPEAMRFRGIAVYTNTTPRGAQRGPGENEMAAAIAPIIDKAAKEAGIDRMTLRRINAPDNDGVLAPAMSPLTSAYLKDAIDKGAELFDWETKNNQPRRQNGSTKVRGVGVGLGYHSAGSSGYDGLIRITPDGKIHLHTGIGNLGTYSYAASVRAAAEVLKCDWESCEIVYGNSDLHLPHSIFQGGSVTIFTENRSNWVAAQDMVTKLKEIAAAELGGSADDYDIADERVFRTDDPSAGITYARAAELAIEMGGRYSGMEYPDNLHNTTKRSVEGLQGSGLIGVAKDELPLEGVVPGLAVGFMEIELDLDTGKYEILNYTGVADCGTIIHPKGYAQAMNGGGVWGIGLSGYERHVYDHQNGLPANVGLYQSKPPTYLDVPSHMHSAAADIADPYNPVGARGVGEPAQGCAAAALTSAISDALDGHLFNRVPVTADMIVNHVAQNHYSTIGMKTNTF